MKKISVLILLIVLTQSLFSQEIISGVVKNENGEDVKMKKTWFGNDKPK